MYETGITSVILCMTQTCMKAPEYLERKCNGKVAIIFLAFVAELFTLENGKANFLKIVT